VLGINGQCFNGHFTLHHQVIHSLHMPLKSSILFPQIDHSKNEHDKTNVEKSNLCLLLLFFFPLTKWRIVPLYSFPAKYVSPGPSVQQSKALLQSSSVWSASVLHTDMHFNMKKVRDGNSTACCCDSRHLTERLLDTLQFKII